MRLLVRAALVLVGVALIGFFVFVPAYVERDMNRVRGSAPVTVSARALELHARLPLVDLHADTLLWGRDPLQRADRGHVDVPRLIAGNVALQAFTIVTQSPRGLNLEANDDRTDTIVWLAMAQRYPVRAWFRLSERALHQAQRLQSAARRSEGRLSVITSAAELRAYLARRRTESGITAGLLGIEGAHALDGDLSNLDRFHAAGIRMIAPTHFFDNDIAGSAHGLRKGGLTTKGRALIRRMDELRMIVDLAHASARTVDDVLALATRPVLVSHTGVKGTCDNRRNLSDAQLRAIAARGGLIAIGYWPEAVCGTDPAAIARAIRHAARIAGVEHVALGSDFDGAVTVPFDVSDVVLVTESLLQVGFDESAIRAVMGGNALRFLEANLP